MVNITRDRSGYGYSIISNGKMSGDVRLLEGAQRILSDEGGFRTSDQVYAYIERLKKAVFGGRIEFIKDRLMGASGFRITDDTGQVVMEETGYQNAVEAQEFISDLKAAILEGVQVGLVAEKQTIQFNAPPAPKPSTPTPSQPGVLGLADIERLAELHEKGILTDEEFTKKKTEILEKLKV